MSSFFASSIASGFAASANDPLLLAFVLPTTDSLIRIALLAAVAAAVLIPAILFSEHRAARARACTQIH